MNAAPKARFYDPIFQREMRQSARQGRTPWIVLCLILVTTLLMAFVGGIAATTDTSPASVGAMLFQVFFSVAAFIVMVQAPTVAANGIASEREGRTWEALLLTGLSSRAIARGKFIAAYVQVALYLCALAPVGALPFLFGGVTATEVIVAFVFLLLFAGLAVAYGLAVSSLVPSLRAAIVLTLVLAIIIGPSLYSFFGFGMSLAMHQVWPEVPEAAPVWLPLAFVRAPFGFAYVLYLIVMPVLGLVLPAWYLYALTVTNLTGEADDRTTPLKVWFAVATPLLALAAVAPALLVPGRSARVAAAIAALSALSLHLTFVTLHFAFDTPGPSRRVKVRWQREKVSAITRFFGPGIGRTFFLLFAEGILAYVGVAALGILGLALDPSGTVDKAPWGIGVFAVYAIGFYAFVVGLVAALRARGLSPWATRLVAVGILAFVSLGPWVVAAVGGALERDASEWIILGAPSPFYAVYMVERVEHVAFGSLALTMGLGAALAWGLTGIGLLGIASRRAHLHVRDQEEAIRRADAAFAAEEAPAPPAAP